MKKTNLRIQQAVSALLMLAVIGLAGWLSTQYKLEFDWTAILRNTLTAASLKLWSSDPKVSFLAHARIYADALARGELLPPAKSVAEMQAIVFNDRVDAALCGLFLVVVLSLLVFSVRTCLAALRNPAPSVNEAPLQMVPA
jgi:hypothetical protein